MTPRLRRARRRPSFPWRWVRRDEGGFMLVMLTLSLTTLVVCAAFAVDVGGWYARAAKIQRAADAAALAGVVWMPDFPASETAALAAAARNGFVPSGTIAIDVSPVAGSPRQLSVAITDSNAPRSFSGFVPGSQSLARQATAEYVMPVPLGSPRNSFGTGSLLAGAAQERFWAAVNGYCAGHESGDLRLARYESYSTDATSALDCNEGWAQTPDYDPAGYLYAVELLQDEAQLILELYDGGYNALAIVGMPDTDVVNEIQTVTTVFEVFDADNTPLDTSDNPLLSTTTIGNTTILQQNSWQPLYTWTAPEAGTYYVRVKTLVEPTESRGSNGFGLRAHTSSPFVSCTTIVGQTGYLATCPQVHGVGAMSIYANLGGISGSTVTLYLAEVAALHAGKTMQLTLFDAGEGAQRIEVLDPNGNPATFSWRTPCNPPISPTGGVCSGSNVTSLTVSGTGLRQPFAGLEGSSRYNDRRMILDVSLPSTYPAGYGTNRWWRIRYTIGSTTTDRTTWSVNILGDPVHLVED